MVLVFAVLAVCSLPHALVLPTMTLQTIWAALTTNWFHRVRNSAARFSS
jgi:hypothetical protein